MMRDDDDARLDRTVDALADAADAGALEGSEDRPLPPFAAVVARAQRIDPSVLRSASVAEGSGSSTAPPRPSAESILDRLVAAARDDAEASARQHQTAPPLLSKRAPRRALGLAAAAVVLCAGAAVAGMVSLGGDAVDRADGRDPSSLAAAAADRNESGGLATPGQAERSPARRPRRAARAHTDDTADADEPLQAAPLEVVEGEAADDPALVVPQSPGTLPPSPEETDSPATVDEPKAGTSRTGRRKRRLARLDQRAADALASGDLAEADDLLARLIRGGGKDRLVEAAYGDRFAIAHRLHSAAAQRRLWRSYLERFPAGRFAQDARAGLCRRAPKDSRGCWQRYLEDYPSGAYRAQAERALRPAEPDPGAKP